MKHFNDNYLINSYRPVHPIILGEFRSVYGILGWLHVISYTKNTEDILNYFPWFIQNKYGWHFIVVEKWKCINHKIIIKIKDIKDRFSAKLMVNYKIFVEYSQLPRLNIDEYYWLDVIGCMVITLYKYKLGKIVNIIETGSNDVLVVHRKVNNVFGFKEYLVPFIYNSVIREINLIKRIIYVDWDPNF